ncbi:MAG: UPF0149 family protein [Oceanococcus sp.]
MTAKFTTSQAHTLRAFLSDSHRPDGTLSYPQLAGFLFAICASPEQVQVDDWMSVIFDDQDPAYFNEKEDTQIQENLIALYQWVLQGIATETASLPPLCEAQEQVLENFAEDGGLAQWSQGFLIGHDWLEEVWNDLLPEDRDEDLGECMISLSFFASKELALEWQEELGESPDNFENLTQQQILAMPGSMRDYAALGASIAKPDKTD